MKDNKEVILHFAALVPHRDIEILVRNFSNRLFISGYHGARALPHIIPLAKLKKPLNDNEWKQAAYSLRDNSTTAGNGSLIQGNRPEAVMYKDVSNMLVLPLDMPAADFPADRLICNYSPALWLAVLEREQEYNGPDFPLSFKTAALAQTAITRINGVPGNFSFRWTMQIKAWLPKLKK